MSFPIKQRNQPQFNPDLQKLDYLCYNWVGTSTSDEIVERLKRIFFFLNHVYMRCDWEKGFLIGGQAEDMYVGWKKKKMPVDNKNKKRKEDNLYFNLSNR